MTIKASPPPPENPENDGDGAAEASPACVLVFNASDPSGAGGLTADITTIASVGGHPIAVVTGAYARDTAEIFEHFSFDDEAVAEQARAVLEDLPVQAIKVGFVGSAENISAIAEITTDYVAELYSLRRVLETFAIQRAVERATPLNIETLRSIVAEMHAAADEGDSIRLGQLDITFHCEICRSAHHVLLMQMWKAIEMGVRRCLALRRA